MGDNLFSNGATKSTVSCLLALIRMVDMGLNVKYVIEDGDRGLISKIMNKSLYSRGICFKTVSRSVIKIV